MQNMPSRDTEAKRATEPPRFAMSMRPTIGHEAQLAGGLGHSSQTEKNESSL
jgi:hypothetical protein